MQVPFSKAGQLPGTFWLILNVELLAVELLAVELLAGPFVCVLGSLLCLQNTAFNTVTRGTFQDVLLSTINL